MNKRWVRSGPLRKLVRELRSLEEERDLEVFCQYLPGSLNVLADAASRTGTEESLFWFKRTSLREKWMLVDSPPSAGENYIVLGLTPLRRLRASGYDGLILVPEQLYAWHALSVGLKTLGTLPRGSVLARNSCGKVQSVEVEWRLCMFTP